MSCQVSADTNTYYFYFLEVTKCVICLYTSSYQDSPHTELLVCLMNVLHTPEKVKKLNIIILTFLQWRGCSAVALTLPMAPAKETALAISNWMCPKNKFNSCFSGDTRLIQYKIVWFHNDLFICWTSWTFLKLSQTNITGQLVKYHFSSFWNCGHRPKLMFLCSTGISH